MSVALATISHSHFIKQPNLHQIKKHKELVMSYSQPQELEEYFKQKEEQEKQAEQQTKELSAYEACVLKESARVKELIKQAQNKEK